jgi:hypothetical protein
MPIAPAIPDDLPGDESLTLTARIPEPWLERESRLKYAAPVLQSLSDAGLTASVHVHESSTRTVVIEVTSASMHVFEIVLQTLRDRGAPPDTSIALETSKATLEGSLADLLPAP